MMLILELESVPASFKQKLSSPRHSALDPKHGQNPSNSTVIIEVTARLALADLDNTNEHLHVSRVEHISRCWC